MSAKDPLVRELRRILLRAGITLLAALLVIVMTGGM